MKKVQPLLIILFLFLLNTIMSDIVISRCLLPENSSIHYQLSIKIDPLEGRIEGTLEINSAEEFDSCFLLNKNLRINSIVCDNHISGYHNKIANEKSQSDEIVIESKIKTNILIKYSGILYPDSLPRAITMTNMISKRLVELSDYIDWYPRMKNVTPFTYDLTIDVPDGFTTVASGLPSGDQMNNYRFITQWKSIGKVYGISFISVPGLKKSIVTGSDFTSEVYYSRLPETYIDSLKEYLEKGAQLLIDLFGKPNAGNLARFIYSPRAAGGYARAPLVFVSEQFALEQRKNKYGFARDLRLNIHELAHYWSMADVNTPDDWLNEGLAEYAALFISEQLSGKEFSKILIEEYEGIIRSSESKNSILETKGISIDREINRYYKPAILFNELKTRFGSDKLKLFFKELYIRFRKEGKANTVIFIDELGNFLGREAKDYFYVALNKKDWTVIKEDSLSTAYGDSLYLGKWEGPLTQFGTTMQFVFNLKMMDGKLVSTLESPDQGVKDIPVSNIIIEGDSIKFSVGVAAARFEGNLLRASNIIEGKWIQRDVEYPLVMKKQSN